MIPATAPTFRNSPRISPMNPPTLARIRPTSWIDRSVARASGFSSPSILTLSLEDRATNPARSASADLTTLL